MLTTTPRQALLIAKRISISLRSGGIGGIGEDENALKGDLILLESSLRNLLLHQLEGDAMILSRLFLAPEKIHNMVKGDTQQGGPKSIAKGLADLVNQICEDLRFLEASSLPTEKVATSASLTSNQNFKRTTSAVVSKNTTLLSVTPNQILKKSAPSSASLVARREVVKDAVREVVKDDVQEVVKEQQKTAVKDVAPEVIHVKRFTLPKSFSSETISSTTVALVKKEIPEFQYNPSKSKATQTVIDQAKNGRGVEVDSIPSLVSTDAPALSVVLEKLIEESKPDFEDFIFLLERLRLDLTHGSRPPVEFIGVLEGKSGKLLEQIALEKKKLKAFKKQKKRDWESLLAMILQEQTDVQDAQKRLVTIQENLEHSFELRNSIIKVLDFQNKHKISLKMPFLDVMSSEDVASEGQHARLITELQLVLDQRPKPREDIDTHVLKCKLASLPPPCPFQTSLSLKKTQLSEIGFENVDVEVEKRFRKIFFT